MPLFVNDGGFVTIGKKSYKKEKVVTITEDTESKYVSVFFDNDFIEILSYDEHASDNSVTTFTAFSTLCKTLFGVIGGGTNGGSGGSSVTTNIVVATSSLGGITKGEKFILEVTTDGTGAKTYAGITSGGVRTTTVPTWVVSSNESYNESVKSSVAASSSSVELVGYDENRLYTIIFNESNNDDVLYISMKSPATVNDAIRVESGGYVTLNNIFTNIYGIWNSNNGGFARIENIKK